MAFRSGTTVVQGTGTTFGAAVSVRNLSNPIGFGAHTSSRSTSMTLAARQLQPPKLKTMPYESTLKFVLGVFVLVPFAAVSFALMLQGGVASIFGLVLTALSAGLLFKMIRERSNLRSEIDYYNNEVYSHEIAAWENWWVCHRCGYVGPISGSPSTPPPVQEQ